MKYQLFSFSLLIIIFGIFCLGFLLWVLGSMSIATVQNMALISILP